MPVRLWIAALAALTLAGCGTTPGDPPATGLSALLAPVSHVAASKNKGGNSMTLKEPDACEGLSVDPPPSRPKRDACIIQLKSLIDAAYFPYRTRVMARVEAANLSLDAGSIVFGTASTAVGAAGTKTILSAIQTVLTSSRAAIGEDMLRKSAVELIVNQMDADRARLATQLREAMKADDYPLDQGKNDLLAYLYAGTTTGAVSSLQVQVAANAAGCKAAEQKAKARVSSAPSKEEGAALASADCGQTTTLTTSYEYRDSGKAIEAIWRPEGLGTKPDMENAKILNTCFQKLKLDGVDIPSAINDKSVTEIQRQKILGCFHALKSN